MDEIHKFGSIIVIATWIVGIIAVIFISIFAPDGWWLSYVIGLFTALMNFGLMIKSARKLKEKALKQEEVIFNPKKIALAGYGLRILVFVAIFAVITYDQFKTEEPRFFVIPALIGYGTLKLVTIVYGLIKRGKVINVD